MNKRLDRGRSTRQLITATALTLFAEQGYEAAHDQAVRRIVLTDAPAVVGWRAWREIDGAHGLGLLRRAFAAGRLPADQVELYAQGLLAVLIEMALLIAANPTDENVVRSGMHFVELIVSRLFGVEPGAAWPDK